MFINMKNLFHSLSAIKIIFFLLVTCSPIAIFAQVPNCAVYTSPADGANGNGGRTTLTWTAPGSGTAPTGYKLFFGTDIAATNIVNGTHLGPSSYMT